jgi:rhamnogalacturonyl hydrolase YesR
MKFLTFSLMSSSLCCSNVDSRNHFRKRNHRRDTNSLTYETCVKNNGTTWTYNQSVILSPLALLYNATKNVALINLAQKIAAAVTERLPYSNSVLIDSGSMTYDYQLNCIGVGFCQMALIY